MSSIITNYPALERALNIAETAAIGAIGIVESAPIILAVGTSLLEASRGVSQRMIIEQRDIVRSAFLFLKDAAEETLQNHAYPCNKLPPALVKPPESLIEGTVLAALFALYATCMRLTNPDDLGYQLQPEARQLINDAINKVRYTCEQPTDRPTLEKLK